MDHSETILQNTSNSQRDFLEGIPRPRYCGRRLNNKSLQNYPINLCVPLFLISLFLFMFFFLDLIWTFLIVCWCELAQVLKTWNAISYTMLVDNTKLCSKLQKYQNSIDTCTHYSGWNYYSRHTGKLKLIKTVCSLKKTTDISKSKLKTDRIFLRITVQQSLRDVFFLFLFSCTYFQIC